MHRCRLSTGLSAPKTLSASFFFAPKLTSPAKLQMTTLNICRILSANSLFSLCVCVSMWLFQAQSAKDSVPLRKAPGIPVNKDKPVRKFGKRVREKFASHRTLI